MMQLTVLIAVQRQLHPVTAFHLERGIVVGMTAGGMRAAVMVMAGLSLFGGDGGLHRQAGRVVVFMPLADATDNGDNEHTGDQYEHQ